MGKTCQASIIRCKKQLGHMIGQWFLGLIWKHVWAKAIVVLEAQWNTKVSKTGPCQLAGVWLSVPMCYLMMVKSLYIPKILKSVSNTQLVKIFTMFSRHHIVKWKSCSCTHDTILKKSIDSTEKPEILSDCCH